MSDPVSLAGNSITDLGGSGTCLTVNQRLARGLRGRFDARCLAEGRSAWESPDILPFSAWLQRGWAELSHRSGGPLPILLGPFQEHALWDRIIRAGQGPSEAALLQVSRAAREAMTAWARIKGWRVPEAAYRATWDEDTRMFCQWAERFVALCREQAWIDPGSALDALIAALRGGEMPVPPRVTLAGFEEWTPQQRDLLDALAAGGAEIVHWTPRARSATCVRVPLAHEEAELATAARWARALMEDGAPGPIGVVIPELTRMRPAVSRVFQGVLHPAGRFRGGVPTSAPPFNISLGEPLARTPLARDALLSLRLADGGRHPVSAFSQFLLSPYFAGAESELMARARLDLALRAMGEPWLTFATFSRHLAAPADAEPHDSDAHGPGFRAGLSRGAALLGECPPQQTLPDWARTFSQWLGALGWPGEGPLESDEYQTLGAFHELLAEFAGLNLVVGPCSFRAALSRLRQVAEQRLFQPKSTPTATLAPVQVLGLREAAGLTFSHLWVLGLHAEAWPPPPRPNPFLPLELQRRAGMPRAGPEIALAEARRATHGLLGSAGAVVVSYPKTGGDLPRAPSPLIAMLPPIDPASLPQADIPDMAVAWGMGPGKAWEPLLDGPPLPLEPHEPREESLPAGHVGSRGGAGIWRDQAACPFRAFARHRLGAAGLDTPTLGLDAALRGILVHRALELIWRALGDSHGLARMGDEALRGKVEKAVDRALLEAARRRPETLGGRLREMERMRLVRLVMAWLALERERPPFTVIAPERGRVVSFGDLPVSIRPDRVDRIEATGQYLLIDYKTGNAALADWFGERPANPQLPLYALAQGSDGVAFAFLGRRKMGMEGIARGPDTAPGVVALAEADMEAARGFHDWDGLCDQWRRALVSLAEGFVRGEARVDPKSPDETCRYCDLHPLCRVWAA
uniref:Probable DNA repair protein n=1 Tax=Candidatus Kentrum eta TaxID=2126337 RepID=A0A450V572_9GAMM|nr:MAG: probable DNA repair protein [Candidatus Kentron sp. H]VFJ93086.1 MAG: probable DNA repair protein [Candidatus Kentron sp. H]VFJ99937.1 MAG: probable DNA repair protein [Candidatus Kentron sp. H]